MPLNLELLGVVGLRDAEGRELESLLRCPKRFALLAYLAVAHPRGFHRRDRLVALFWPDLDASHARAALRQYLFNLRAELGHERVPARGSEEVALDPRHLRCDVWELEGALAGEQPERAVRAYRGDLLSGMYVSGSPDFDQWLDGERDRLRTLAADAAWRAAERAAECGQLECAVRFARRGVEIVPYDETGVRRLVELLDLSGDRAGAVREYETFARRLAGELELEPSPELRATVERVRVRARPNDVATPNEAPRAEGDDGRFLADAVPALEPADDRPVAPTPTREYDASPTPLPSQQVATRRVRRWTWREAIVALSLSVTTLALDRIWM